MSPSIPDTTPRRHDLNNNNNINGTSSTCMDPWIHLLVTSLPDPIFTCDLLGNVLALNPGAQHTFGLDLYQSIGQNLNLLFPKTNLSLTSTSNAHASVATLSIGNPTKEKDKLKEPKDPHRHNNNININNNIASSLPPQGSSPNSGNSPNFASNTFDDVDKYPCSLEQLVSLKLPLKRLVTKTTRDGARPFLESISALYSSGHTQGEHNGQSGGPVGYSIVLTDVSALFPSLQDPPSNIASQPTSSPFASSTPTTSSSITNSLPKATLLEIKNESNKAHAGYDPSTSSGAASSTSTPKVTIVEPPYPLALPTLASSSMGVPSIPQESTSNQSQTHNQDPSEAPQAPRNSVRSTSLGQLLSLTADSSSSSSRRPRSLSVAATAVSSTPSGTQMSVSMASQKNNRLDIHHSTLAPVPAMAPLSSATSSTLAPAAVLNLDEDHDWGDPCLPYLAPIAASLLTCHGDALFELAVEELAMHLGVKYAFVSQLVSLDELKDLDPAEYANLIDQFGGVVPPIDGVMHNISSWPGESHINPHAFQGYLADCTIQDKVTCIHSELAMLHPDVAECLMDFSIESYVGLRLETDQGEIVGVIGIIHDRALNGDDALVVKMVLERVGLRVANELDWMRIEANLIYARDVAESTAKNKTKFLADMSHEIRNPMNAVVGVTDILLDTVGLSDEQTGYIEVIRTSGQHLLTVINDILDISRIDQDVKFLLEKRPLSLRKCLKDAVSLAGLTPLHDVSRSISVIEWPPEMDDLGPFSELEETNILPLLWSIDHNVPEHLLGDITRLRQVLINLCTNSLKFTQRGRVSVHVSVHQPSQHPTIHPNASPMVTRNSPLSTSSSQAPEGVVSSPSSPMMVGCDQRPQMVFQQRYDVKADAGSSAWKPPPSSRRRQGDAFPPSSRSRTSIAPIASGSSHTESSPHPPSLKVVAPTANSMQGVAKDEGSVILEFAVSDTGVGIPANKITDLFTSFSQVDISVSTRFGGTGLGLAISASLVEKMGGHIWVESTEGVGSRFTFTIPFTICQSPESESYSSSTAPSSPVSAPEPSSSAQEPVLPPVMMLPTVMEESKEDIAPSPTKPTSAPESPKTSTPTYAKIVESAPKPLSIDGAPLRILLAEDNNVNQKIAVGVLKKLGYEDVDVAENGLEVIDKLDAGRVYDVILMDVSMPVMDGIDATRTIIDRRTRGMLMSSAFAGDSEHLSVQDEMASSEPLPNGLHKPELKQLILAPHDKDAHMYKDYQNVYVIALTASAMGSDKERCMDAGMDDFMTKPFVVLEMKRALSEYISRLRSGALQSRNEACLAAALAARSRCRSPTCQGIALHSVDERPSTPTFPPALSASSSTLSLSELTSMECQGCGSVGSETGSNVPLPSTSSGRPSRLETPRPVRKGLDGSGPYSLGRRSNSEAILIPSTSESSSPLLSNFGANVLESCNMSRRASESLGKREWRESPPASRSGLSNGSWANGRHRVHPLDKEGASGEGVLAPQMLKTKSSLYMDSSLDDASSPVSSASSDSCASSSPSPPQTNSSATAVMNGINGHHHETKSSEPMTLPSPANSLPSSLTPSPSPVVISEPISASTSGPSIQVPSATLSSTSSSFILPPLGVSTPLTPPPLTPPPNAVHMKTIKRDEGIECLRMPSAL